MAGVVHAGCVCVVKQEVRVANKSDKQQLIICPLILCIIIVTHSPSILFPSIFQTRLHSDSQQCSHMIWVKTADSGLLQRDSAAFVTNEHTEVSGNAQWTDESESRRRHLGEATQHIRQFNSHNR